MSQADSIDIAIIGPAWALHGTRGQREAELVREFLTMGNRVLYVETEATMNHADHDNKPLRIVRLLREPKVGDIQEGPELSRDNLTNAIKEFCQPQSKRMALFEVPIGPHLGVVEIFRSHGFRTAYELTEHLGEKWSEGKTVEEYCRIAETADIVSVRSKLLMEKFIAICPWRTDALLLPDVAGPTAERRWDRLARILSRATETGVKTRVDQVPQKQGWGFIARSLIHAWKCYQRDNRVVWECTEVGQSTGSGLFSIIVLSLNTRDSTSATLESIRCHSDASYELIVVDNGSTDGSKEMLQEMKRRGIVKEVISCERNLGYAGGNNMGLRYAKGDILLFVNSDTIVSPYWLSKFRHRFSYPATGAVGPVSNNVGPVNFPQRVRYQNQKAGRVIELRRISGFCVAISRKCLDKVGTWDERFFPGFYDDDDMSIRISRAGFKLICDGDIFVHHRLNETFRLNPGIDYEKSLLENGRKFKEKYPEEPATIRYSAEPL